MEEVVFDVLKKRNFIKDDENIAYNEVLIIENEVIIKGNKLGLIQIADYLVQISICEADNNHIHLDKGNYFDNANCEVIIIKE